MSPQRLALSALLVCSGCCGTACHDAAEPAQPATADACGDRTGRTLSSVLGDAEGIALGCRRVEGPARLLELFAVNDAGGPCIVITGLPDGPRACARAPGERVPAVRRHISAGPIVRRSIRSGVEVYGETSAEVDRVLLRYRLPGGRRATTRATLIEADSAAARAAAGIDEPFAVFVGQIPSRARHVVAEGQDRSGHTLGRAQFSGLMRDGRATTAFVAESR